MNKDNDLLGVWAFRGSNISGVERQTKLRNPGTAGTPLRKSHGDK
jgi:hypothetical protein